MNTIAVITKEELLKYWLGHRNLTKRVIEKFPEDKLFTFSLANMRTFGEMANELIAIAVPGLTGIVNQTVEAYGEKNSYNTKVEILAIWDQHTEELKQLWAQLQEEDFHKTFNLFGQYEFPIIDNILYFIDNEIHHRGQGYVYLRALGIEPPFFWER
ncbi:damage-inducible protein DinB [Sphingobacterium sp. SRCM116780]|uniref:DinB family protein n=1 Tax=Sphingobacterium sp. SRCM116780 TaxID=2907623 RepID=UPI001F2E0E0D|nr:DinB family protein [Sphingobacterium sp. SRCM116780]UIR57716.1 damage-inducible protein DinB [Sphingobacterium sp. SRCM116780]